MKTELEKGCGNKGKPLINPEDGFSKVMDLLRNTLKDNPEKVNISFPVFKELIKGYEKAKLQTINAILEKIDDLSNKEIREIKKEHCDWCGVNEEECSTCKPEFDKIRNKYKELKEWLIGEKKDEQ